MSKRHAAEALAENDGHGPNGEPPRKRVVFEPLQLGPIANLVTIDALFSWSHSKGLGKFT
jgi:hypothetical protein